MDEYINTGKKILKVLNNNGFEAYFIGESVRNSILKKGINRVDITTSANVSAIRKLFSEYSIDFVDDNTLSIYYDNYLFYINSFLHKNSDSDNFSSGEKHYSKSLLEDLANRDFTINAIAMSHSGKLTDVYNGYNDIVKKKIRHIGKAKIKFHDDPSLIIKAFALVSELDYNFDKKTKIEINRRRKYLVRYDSDCYIEDLIKIFNGPYAKKAILLMNKTNIDMVIPVLKKVIRLLGHHYKKVNFQEMLLMAFLLNGSIDKRFEEYVEDHTRFIKLFNVASQYKKGNYDNITLFNYGLEICLEANRINNLLRRCRNKSKKIKKKWNALRIKSTNDLMFNKVDIERIIHPRDYHVIDDILLDAAVAVLAGEIKNTVTDVQSVVIHLLKQNSINYNINGMPVDYEFEKEERLRKEREAKKQHDLDIINRHLINQQRRNYRNNEIEDYFENKKTSAEDLTSLSMDYIKDNEKLKKLVGDNKDFEEKLKKFIDNYIEEGNGQGEN